MRIVNIIAGVSFVVGTIFFGTIPCISLYNPASDETMLNILNLSGCLLYLIGTTCYLVTSIMDKPVTTEIPDKIVMSDSYGSEYHRMMRGEFYTWKDDEITQVLKRPRALIQRFNAIDANDYPTRQTILKDLLADIGDGSFIEAPFKCDFGHHITIGKNTFVNYNCVFNDYGRISIGDNVLIGFNVLLITSIHPTNPIQRLEKRNDAIKYVIIGNNVWIGAAAIILPGVTIGDNSVIGAGSVVTKDIPPGCLAVGNPCKIIKRFQLSVAGQSDLAPES